jgi:hypothetical protein
MEVVEKGVIVATISAIGCLVGLLEGTDDFETFATSITTSKILSLTLLGAINTEKNHNCQEYNQ